MTTRQKFFFISILIFGFCAELSAQNFSKYSVQNAHSHNDYHQKIPFWAAYNEGFGSIEADVFYQNNAFLVGHDPEELSQEKTLENLYLYPIVQQIKLNNGSIYKDPSQKLILFIELKTPSETSLKPLVNLLNKYPEITGNKTLKLIITGNVPSPEQFKKYPQYLYFDGDFTKNYTPQQLERVGMFSSDLGIYTKWHGKGIPRDEETEKLKASVEKAHKMGKPVRFWGAPDFENAWVNLIDAGADYINTDRIPELSRFLKHLPKTFFKNEANFDQYLPKYSVDNQKKTAKNVILFVADGVSLPQYYAAFTANKGNLNVFRMKSTGFSKTNSYNAYITDSAPGSTAFATGVKTKNNFVGVDHLGKNLVQLPEILYKKGIETALISTGDITDATPADFYAHTNDRDNSEKIVSDFIQSNVKVLIGGPTSGFTEKNKTDLKAKNIAWENTLEKANFSSNRLVITDPKASTNVSEGRGKWLREAFNNSLSKLKTNKNGFFMMVEASRTDGNAHANHLGNVVQELLDLDEVVGDALKFADENPETLVIVLGDHETGGLTILDGSLKDGWVLGNFSTNDHTAIPAAVFAYGAQSGNFRGLFENTEVFNKILEAYHIQP